MNEVYGWAWGILAVLIAGWEIAAIKNPNMGDTLSEFMYKILGTKGRPKPKRYLLRRGIVVGFLVWLPLHWLGVGPF